MKSTIIALLMAGSVYGSEPRLSIERTESPVAEAKVLRIVTPDLPTGHYALEASSDLETWEPVVLFTEKTGSLSVTVAEGSPGRRFFRVVIAEP